MGFTLQELQGQSISFRHPGATTRATYIINGSAYCFRPLSSSGNQDQFCSQEAGYGTGHLGEGACRYHYGLNDSAMITRYSKHLKKDLNKTYTEFAQDEQHLLDLTPELIMLRALLTNAITAFQDTQSIKALELTIKLLSSIGETVDRIDRIQSRQVITAAAAKMAMAKAIQVATQFIEPDKLPAFIELWRSQITSMLQPSAKPVVEIPALAAIMESEDD